ncbi:MAG: hypothetical protein ABIQ39_10875, partial [Ilumatobacteraceae bacterium]
MTSPEALVEADAAIRRTWATIADNQRPDIADDLVIRHSEPLRRYHNTMHVMWVLRHVEWLLVRCAVATD